MTAALFRASFGNVSDGRACPNGKEVVQVGDMDETPPEGETINCRLVKWTDIQKWSEDVARRVSCDGYTPDIIVGITRGGWVPARIICDVLGVKHLYSLKTEHWGVTATPDGEAKLVARPQVDMKGKRVLLVDDITDTGASLRLARDWISTREPSEVRVATLLHITHSELLPDYFTVEVPKEEWAWFIFPWNLHEDIRTLLPKTLHVPRNRDGITGAFQTQFNIIVEPAVIERALDQLAGAGSVRQEGGLWKA